MFIGLKIKKIREFKNLTQEHLADKLGMSVAGYGKIEREETDLPFSRLQQIATVFNMKTEDLVGFDEQMVLNIMHNQFNDINVNKATINNKERELYEKSIRLLEDKVAILETLAQR